MRPAPISVALLNASPLIGAGFSAVMAAHSHRVRLEDAAVGAPVPTTIDLALYDAISNPDQAAQWSQFLAPGWTPRQVVLLVPDAGTGCRHRAQAETRALVMVPLLASAEAFVAALEEIHDTGVLAASMPTRDEGSPGEREGLSERESEIIALIARGMTNQDLAEQLYLSVNTVKTYIRSAYRKIGVTTRQQAVLWGVDHGFRPQSPTMPRSES